MQQLKLKIILILPGEYIFISSLYIKDSRGADGQITVMRTD